MWVQPGPEPALPLDATLPKLMASLVNGSLPGSDTFAWGQDHVSLTLSRSGYLQILWMGDSR